MEHRPKVFLQAATLHGVAHHVVQLRPEDGEIVALAVGAVEDNLDAVHRALCQPEVAACTAIFLSIHIDGLHMHVAEPVALLVEHGDNSMLAHAVHEEIDGIQRIIDDKDIATQRLGDIAEVGVAVGEVGTAHTDEHRVIAHEEVILQRCGILVEEEDGHRLAPLRSVVGA